MLPPKLGAAVALLVSTLPWHSAAESCYNASTSACSRDTDAKGDTTTFLQDLLHVQLNGETKLALAVQKRDNRSTENLTELMLPTLVHTRNVDLPWKLSEHVPGSERVLKIAVLFALFVFCAFLFADGIRFARLLRIDRNTAEEMPESQPPYDATTKPETSLLARQRSFVDILGLTIVRLYTGFLSGTWLPFLLAMEGFHFCREDQSLFMGIAKLIYGVTMLLNPIIGVFGDRAVGVSHGLSRRLFIRIGVLLSATGIFICMGADRSHDFYLFMTGVVVWRLGDCIFDVTAEVLIPELVPPTQYGLAGGLKAASFLLGALSGYGMLIIFADLSYQWLYYVYLCGMLACAAPMLLLLNDFDTEPREAETTVEGNELTLQAMFMQAYGCI